MLTFGLPVLGLYLPPMIALFAWIFLLWRVRSWILLAGVGVLLALILLTSVNPLLATVSNPYLALVLVLSAIGISLIGQVDDTKKRYLVLGYGVCLLMMMSLHGWAVFIRQRDLYFYQRSDAVTSIWFGLLMIFALVIPMIGMVRWWRSNN